MRTTILTMSCATLKRVRETQENVTCEGVLFTHPLCIRHAWPTVKTQLQIREALSNTQRHNQQVLKSTVEKELLRNADTTHVTVPICVLSLGALLLGSIQTENGPNVFECCSQSRKHTHLLKLHANAPVYQFGGTIDKLSKRRQVNLAQSTV